MFQVGERKRTRRTLEVDKPPTRRRLSVDSIGENAPLRGAVVCLTGIPSDEKTRMHQFVEQLGGSFTRDLDTAKTTHLIAQDPEGAKYETAAACPNIRVVSPTWLEECVKTGKCVDETLHPLAIITAHNHFLPLEQEIEQELQYSERNDLFASCRFLLLGFNDDSDVKLGRLIRRGKGTIYWEPNEIITHIIVADDCDDSHRDAARTISLYHPNGPTAISPFWIVSSWKDKSFVPTASFPPRKTVVKEMPKKKAVRASKDKRQLSALFRGSVFALLRLSPPSHAANFDAEELESCIMSYGGQMLSSELLEALRADKVSKDSQMRNCYVVCWGGYAPIHMTVHPLLSRIEKEKLCAVVPVTPIWLYSCSADRKFIRPSKNSILFQPQSWPIHRLAVSTKNQSKEDCVKVSVTGFAGSERTGIIQALRVLGASYTENLSNANTHLICNESKGPKYEKAVKWGIHVVSVEWLYHIMEHGYGGRHGDGDVGCEERFSMAPDTKIASDVQCNREDPRETTTNQAAHRPSHLDEEGVSSLHDDFEV